MGTKNSPGKFDCYENAHPDEPMFILLARDPLASILVDLWATMRTMTRGDSPKVLEAIACASTMRRWQEPKAPEGVCGAKDGEDVCDLLLGHVGSHRCQTARTITYWGAVGVAAPEGGETGEPFGFGKDSDV